MKTIKVAVAGNPNVGKSTLFNLLTGINQHVGNYPGVTVEKKEGIVKLDNYQIQLIDLPGIYSMNSFSPEEEVSRKFIVEEKPDLIIDVVDASNIQKNLYLTLQFLEMKVPVLMFLNMVDVAEKKGIFIDEKKLSKEIGIPVLKGVAKKKKGFKELLDKVIEIYEHPIDVPDIPYSQKMEKFVSEISEILKKSKKFHRIKWRAIRFLEGGKQDSKFLCDEDNKKIEAIIEKLKSTENVETYPMLIVQERYHLIKRVVEKSCKRNKEKKATLSDKLDKKFLSSFFAIPIFFLVMLTIFQIVFWIGNPLSELFASFFDFLANFIAGFWQEGSQSLIKSLIVDGIIPGVGGVLAYTPNIFLMFFSIAVLEESGYMSRIAVIMDKYMTKAGLSGKSVVPMMLGFGCSVPAVMAARIIENRWERLATIMVIPFISCGARLPIYILLISAFVPLSWQGAILWGIYLLGAFASLIVAWFLRKTMLKGEENPLIIELPDYATPTMRSLVLLTWQRGKHFLEKAGTVIFAVTVILWVFNTFPKTDIPNKTNLTQAQIQKIESENTVMGRIGKVLEPVFKPMGGDWKIADSFLASIAAKEVFVSQLGILFSEENNADNKSLGTKLKQVYSFPAAIAFILFMLFSSPCMATFAAVKAETNSWKWPIIQFIGMNLIAYGIAVFAFKTLSLFL